MLLKKLINRWDTILVISRRVKGWRTFRKARIEETKIGRRELIAAARNQPIVSLYLVSKTCWEALHDFQVFDVSLPVCKSTVVNLVGKRDWWTSAMLSTDRSGEKRAEKSVTRLMLIQFPSLAIRVGTDRYDFSSRVSDPTVEGETKSKYRSEWIGFGACSIACFCRVLRKGKFSVIIPRGENLKWA